MIPRIRTLLFLPSAANVFASRFHQDSERSDKSVFAKESGWKTPGHSKGQELPLLIEKEGKLALNETNLKKLLCSDNVKDKPVAVISIAGAFRIGKSFALNLLLRYFQNNTEQGWLLEDPWSEINRGISWKGGSDSHTTGIIAWSEPFIVKKSDGTEIAVILLDTQGNFDHGSTKERIVRVFALSTLFSSLQIFNVSKQIQSNDLEHLMSFVEYSKFPILNRADDTNSVEDKQYFQDLLFLVRDWPNPNDFEYGEKGGNRYLSKLKLKSIKAGKESVQLYLESSFKNINCYLMPEPDEKVRIANNDETKPLIVYDLGKKFAAQIEHFTEEFIHPEKLNSKIIEGDTETTGKDLFEHVKNCAEILLSGNGPVIPGEMELIAAHNRDAQREKTLTKYEDMVIQRLENTKWNWNKYDDILKISKEEARNRFKQSTWYGGSAQYENNDGLESRFADKDYYIKSRMLDKREEFVRESIEQWKQKYREQLQSRGWIQTHESKLDQIYTEALGTLIKEDHRDAPLVKHYVEEAKEYLENIYMINKKEAADSNFSQKVKISAVTGTSAAALGAAVNPFVAIPFAVASVGVWFYNKKDK